ncbi:unnamed protein product [Blumeria hordei]|uniref:2'-phosphotransferase n=1 Tax=Blumeria hordei TaxID=2867405 RepID=A0A383UYG8_BLUHO|nr:unnamed protein product [Blumeria hordei]
MSSSELAFSAKSDTLLNSEKPSDKQENLRQTRGKREVNRSLAISKALSKLLRHAAHDAGVQLDKEGYARLDDVLGWQRIKSLNVTFSDIQSVVSQNDKQRFSMKLNPTLPEHPDPQSTNCSDWLIRANQGHSIPVESSSLLTPITIDSGNVPDVIIHGTYFAFYNLIMETGGLSRMNREHIHFSTESVGENHQKAISGMRNDSQILIYVDINSSLADGMKWWLSSNGVALTEGNENGLLPVKYFKKVMGRRERDVGILWENGIEVSKLPESLASRKPPVDKKLPKKTGPQRNNQQRNIPKTDA